MTTVMKTVVHPMKNVKVCGSLKEAHTPDRSGSHYHRKPEC